MICLYCAHELGLNQDRYHRCEAMRKAGADSPLAMTGGRFKHETKTIMDPGDDEPVTVSFDIPAEGNEVTKILEWEELRKDLAWATSEFIRNEDLLPMSVRDRLKGIRKKWGL